jgi:hypothetical protein
MNNPCWSCWLLLKCLWQYYIRFQFKVVLGCLLYKLRVKFPLDAGFTEYLLGDKKLLLGKFEAEGV